MGLDNGICVRRHCEGFERNYKNFFARFDTDSARKYDYDPDICYWRKCWNIRSKFMLALPHFEDCGQSPMSREDVAAAIEILSSFTEDSWNMDYDEGLVIWEWEEAQPWLCEQTAALSVLYDLMESDSTIEAYFYDSY